MNEAEGKKEKQNTCTKMELLEIKTNSPVDNLSFGRYLETEIPLAQLLQALES